MLKSKAFILAAFTTLCAIILTAYILRSNDVKTELSQTSLPLEAPIENQAEDVRAVVEVANSPPENTFDESPKIIKETEAEVIINLTEPDTFEEPPPEAILETPVSQPSEMPTQQSPEATQPKATPPATTPSAPQSSTPVPGSTNSNGEFYDPVFGWVKPGEVVVTHIDSDGDINKMVGSMG